MSRPIGCTDPDSRRRPVHLVEARQTASRRNPSHRTRGRDWRSKPRRVRQVPSGTSEVPLTWWCDWRWNTVGCCVCGVACRAVSTALTLISPSSENEGGERRAEVDRACRAPESGKSGQTLPSLSASGGQTPHTGLLSTGYNRERDAIPRLSERGVGQGHPQGQPMGRVTGTK